MNFKVKNKNVSSKRENYITDAWSTNEKHGEPVGGNSPTKVICGKNGPG